MVDDALSRAKKIVAMQRLRIAELERELGSAQELADSVPCLRKLLAVRGNLFPLVVLMQHVCAQHSNAEKQRIEDAAR